MSEARAVSLMASAGLAAAPAVWAIHQQIGYMLVPVSCQTRMLLLPVLALSCMLLVLAAGWLSWRSLQRLQATPEPSPSTTIFIARLSVLFAGLFAFAIAMQGAAMLFLDPCQR